MLDRQQVLPNVIRHRADEHPDRVFVQEVGGPVATYAEFDDRADRWAAALTGLGVRPGSRVVTMLPPRIEALAAWIGIARAGAIDTSVNTDYRGRMLEHVLQTAGASVLVVAEPYLDRFEELWAAVPSVESVVIAHGDLLPPSLPVACHSADTLLQSVQPAPGPEPMPWDVASMIFTSGTTGPSKGVLMPWAQMYAAATRLIPMEDVRADDAFYSPLPTFHAAARFFFHLMALAGGRFVCRDRFNTGEYWDDVRKYDCTIGILLGQFLAAATPRDDDADNPMRMGIMSPLVPDYEEFSRRFGVRLCTAFGMTEVGTAISSGWKLSNAQSCGRLQPGFPGFEARIVDEHDMEVPRGTVGELILRTQEPWTLSAGYFGMSDKTAEAWRNGWFHTGDAFRQDEEGNFYFVDRFKDALWRSGENISSFEVEAEVLAHPDVAECAAVAAPGDAIGDEVKIVVAPRPGRDIDPADLIRFLIPRMPRFMVPRYVEIIDELPKTPTMKVRKVELRQNPLNDRTWDRVAAGLELPRTEVR